MSTASYGRSRSGDRFYNPPAVRRQLQKLQQQQQQQQQQPQQPQQQQKQQQQILLQKQKQEREEIRREKQHNHNQNHNQQLLQQQRRRKEEEEVVVVVEKQEREKSSTTSSENRVESDDCASTATTTTTTTTPNSTNLDRFLEATTPSVPAQYFSKTSMKGWRTRDDEFRMYFVLGDLWESFKEWSAYGAGVPLLLNGSDSVVQYYVPYLSGIQLYIDPSKPSPRTRIPGEESDESSRETSSVGSSDCETERGPCSIGAWNQQDLGESNLQDMKALSLRHKPFNGSSSDEGELSNSPGALTFEYFEHAPPFSREPLADKISLLASRFPELKTYRSCDLSASSWISVAWYPIYRIPTGPTLQNLDSCFLTFHSLSTPLRGGQSEWQSQYGSCPREIPNGFNMGLKMPLPIFGMASYKFKISVWDQNGVDECQRANSLLRAADEWLRLLNVNHPDYNFFLSHSFSCR
ncbi:hypothetical protein BVRB_3g048100 [Beta vulgaris subsp. vulgaris]|uniref:uncharacterized protein LOC104887857 n=1 Tax=Beta vulgaris subsp. vulgaris TaxID=3555 RepID=UPI00053FFB93|nr:uncharacterized protein LOC104887857 [Beta vulgaris subsp. vulgaris]KMT16514.1 hypothetical protein BVRB_3g048100 [Beta vulgaris subsp. vulgaris]